MLIALAAASTTLGAQTAAELTVPIRIVVPPTLAIRSVVPAPPRVRGESADAITTTAIVNVESNLPYRLSVRLAPGAADARVLVRGSDGAFQSLARGEAIVAISNGTPGHQAHEITCRVAATTPDGCALVYELSAEYHDMLIRTTAVQAVPASFVLRPASQIQPAAPATQASGRRT